MFEKFAAKKDKVKEDLLKRTNTIKEGMKKTTLTQTP